VRFHDYNPQYDQGYEQEPLMEKGSDSYRFWWRVLVIVVVAGVAIGFVASASYAVYPYSVTVSGTFVASDGSRAQLVAFVECSDLAYSTCPDPGEQPVDFCIAPVVMDMTQYCTEYNLEANPGHYSVSLRNGEDYNMVGYMVNAKGTFDKVCRGTLVLSPMTTDQNSTQDLGC
jgi:hypothetical protein